MIDLDKHCTATWQSGWKRCKMRDFQSCPHPEWPTSCPVVSEGLRKGCKVFSCPTETPEEFYGSSGTSSSSEAPESSTQDNWTTVETVNRGSLEDLPNLWIWIGTLVTLVILFMVGELVWCCCLSEASRQQVRTWIAILRDDAIAFVLACWRGAFGRWNRFGRQGGPAQGQGAGQGQQWGPQGQGGLQPPIPLVQLGAAQVQGAVQGQQGGPQGQGGPQPFVVPPGNAVLAQVGLHLVAPPPPAVGLVAQLPPPPNRQVQNPLFRVPNLPPLPQRLQQALGQQQVPPPPPAPPLQGAGGQPQVQGLVPQAGVHVVDLGLDHPVASFQSVSSLEHFFVDHSSDSD